MNQKQWREKLKELPPDGEWWKRHNGEIFVWAAMRLQKHGVAEDEIFSVLEQLYSATADEFGS